MKFAECVKCGKKKLASVNRKVDNLTVKDIEVVVGYGRNRGNYRCKDCKVESRFNNDLSLFGGWTSTDELKKHYVKGDD